MTGTERKTFQKYYPSDYDPRKLKKERGRKRSNQFVQRVMAPFNMQCNTCHEYIYKGKKFNMRRETAEEDEYVTDEEEESEPTTSNSAPSTSRSSLYSSIKNNGPTTSTSNLPISSLYSSIKKQTASKPKTFLPGIIIKKPVAAPLPNLAGYGSSSDEDGK